ncbi:MAG: bifunctional riboflavin kinase/FAD synthetase [bacterium]|nr:bifunctional riboflavin kinase/FAD synthetase [bacterium]MDE0667408.1 bifunctional riboflavin kinase/FAD synthetase [bacterium]MXZ29398.1 bifunctional riboflavin kinase/FAD synthetase [Acidimicrobiia bacterium]MYB24882.1 bifunctional riboflavin kinase/FAD synthetase [Acidimicrobiia bacterium]
MLVSDSPPAGSPASAVAVGVFDGVHVGHQQILSRVVQRAAAAGLCPTVVTFDTHPAFTLRPQNAPLLLTDLRQKLALFDDLGLQQAVVLPFEDRLATTPAEDFVSRVLVEGLAAKLVVAGADFHFGADRQGSTGTLRVAGARWGFEVETVDLHHFPNAPEPVSSTAIRRALAGSRVADAAQMLGRPYAIRGTVIEGDRRGVTIGFPTANIPVATDRAWPADGVYAGLFCDSDDARYGCAINIGRRPTFFEHAEHSILEAHLLDFDGDLYGHDVQVEFLRFLRSERRFSGIDELAAQLKKDTENARRIVAEIL